jgi:hypothetical protein
MKTLSIYQTIGKTLSHDCVIPASTLNLLKDSFDVHEVRYSCLFVKTRPHVALSDVVYTNEPVQLTLNLSSSIKIEGLPGLPLDFNNDLQNNFNQIHNFKPRPYTVSYIYSTITEKSFLNNVRLSNILYETGLSDYNVFNKAYYIGLNNLRITVLDNIINNRLCLMGLNVKGDKSLVSYNNLDKYITRDQIDYFYPDKYELKELLNDPFVKCGFNYTKNIITPHLIYDISKHGIGVIDVKKSCKIDVLDSINID